MEFLNLTQGVLSVVEYEARFTELGRYAPHIFNEERHKTKKFAMGLRSHLRRFVLASRPQSYVEAVEVAQTMEDEQEDFREEQKKIPKKTTPTILM